MTTAVLTGAMPARADRTAAPGRDMYDVVVTGLLLIFLVFFYVGTRIESLPIPIRIEDFVFILLVPLSYRHLARPKTKLFYWIVAYFAVNLIPYSAAMIAGQYTLGQYPIIMMKEVQYFYVAYLVCQMRSRLIFHTIDILALVIITNGIRAMLAGEIAYYGIGTFGNWTAPSLAGALYLFSTIWLHVRSKLIAYRPFRYAALVAVALGAVCVVATISRSSIGALAVYIIAYIVLSSVVAFPALLVAAGITPKLLQAAALMTGTGVGFIASAVLRRLAVGNVTFDSAERAGKWTYYMKEFGPMDWTFGKGKGYPNALDSTYGLGVDSQYVRVLLENGIVGVVILGAILLTMLTAIKRRGGEYQHAWAMVAAMGVMCLPLEALQVSKSGGFFWLIMFYLLMCQRRPQAARAVPT